jgi:hypothetical protein
MTPLVPVDSPTLAQDIENLEAAIERVKKGETVTFFLIEVGQSGEVISTGGGPAKGATHALLYGLETAKFRLCAQTQLEKT